MGKVRKKKAPVTTTTPPATSSSKPKSSRKVIRQYHVLLKQQAQLEALPTRDAQTSKALDDIKQQMDQLGGLESYQRMSAIGGDAPFEFTEASMSLLTRLNQVKDTTEEAVPRKSLSFG